MQIDLPSLTAFFHLSLSEARSMDPQWCVLLHVVYHALEHSGRDVPDPEEEVHGIDRTGIWISAAGPSSYYIIVNTVNTARSSSLVAIYQTCWNAHELRLQDCSCR
jgi:acyl transferase domain-containing protein